VAFKSLIIGALLVGLFIVAFLQGFNQLAIDNDKPNVLLENDALNRTITSINTSIKDVDATVNKTKVKFEEEKSSVATGFFLLESIFSAGRTFTTMVVAVFTGTFTAFAEILGVPTIVIGVVTAILLISVILMLWSLYKTGR